MLFRLLILIIGFSLNLNAQNFVWAKSFGSVNGSTTGCKSMALDGSDNVYTIGEFVNVIDFDPGPDTFNLRTTSNNFNRDIFISKLSANGNFVWAKKIGSKEVDYVNAIVLNEDKYIYIVGRIYDTTDLDPGPNVYNINVNANPQAPNTQGFLLKLDTAGNFIWAKSLFGVGMSYSNCRSLKIDSSGNFYIVGDYNGTVDFNPGIGTNNLTSNNSNLDVFVLKLDSSGNFLWVKSFGGQLRDKAYDIDIDNSSHVFVTGTFEGIADFDPSPNVLNLSSVGNEDIFITKLNQFGNLIWSKQIGGIEFDIPENIEIDNQNNVFIGGTFGDTVDFDPSNLIYNIKTNGQYDAFVCKLDSSGNFLWARGFGGIYNDLGIGMKFDNVSNVYLTGSFVDQIIFNLNPSFNLLAAANPFDNYIIRFDLNGNVNWAKNFNSMGGYGSCMEFSGMGDIYAGGYFYGLMDFDLGLGTFNINPLGADAYILKMSKGLISSSNFLENHLLNIFPNPNNGIFNLNLNELGYLQVLDVFGKVVSGQNVTRGKSQIQLDNNLHGIYYLKLQTLSGIVTGKIIIN